MWWISFGLGRQTLARRLKNDVQKGTLAAEALQRIGREFATKTERTIAEAIEVNVR
jgi:hypothetical protein